MNDVNKVTLTLPEQYRQFAPTVWPSVAETARAEGYHWIAEQIEAQVPKAPVKNGSRPTPEQVEADALNLQSAELQERLAQAISDPGSVVGRQHHINESVPRWAMRAVLHVLTGSIPTEPTPEQVEAAPAPEDPIEALVARYAGRMSHRDLSASSLLIILRDFAERVALEVMLKAALLPKEPTS